MGKQSAIEWCHHTFNPWWGCTKVSPACDHCYAEALAKRYGFKIWGQDVGRRFFGEKHWQEPLKWDRSAEIAGEQHRVFCGSMCDIMERRDEILNQWREQLYELIEATPHLDWLLLTKRPAAFRYLLPERWLKDPLPNVIGMTTVESAEHLWRAAELLRTPFARRGLSMEPLLGPVDLTSVKCIGAGFMNALTGEDADGPGVMNEGLDWVIVGGESGKGARPMRPDWARSIRGQCVKAGVPFFFKQWGQWQPIARTDGFHESPFGYHTGAPPYLGFSPVGKKKAGALLDGREWREMPR